MIDSASRPNLLKQTLPTVLKHLKYSGEIVWVFHEAVLDENKSNECLALIKDYGMIRGKIVQISPTGEGMSIGSILRTVRTDFFIHWEDDFIALREIDLNLMTKIMQRCPDVNQIIFNRRDTMPDVSGWKKREVIRFGEYLTTSPHWRYTPALWRTDFIKPKWQDFPGNNSHWQMNAFLKKGTLDSPEMKSAEWVIQNLGTYYFGPIDEKAYCRHIGAGHSGRVEGA